MESVIIIAPAEYDPKLGTRLEQVGPVMLGAEGVFVLSDGKTRVYVGRDDSVCNDFEPDHLALIKTKIPDPSFYFVDFTSIVLCRRVIEAVANDSMLLIDNDHGKLLPGPEFVRMLRDRPDWDWRLDRP